MKNNSIIIVILAVLLLVIVLFWRTAQAPDEGSVLVPDDTSEVPSHTDAELVGYNFMQDVILVAPPNPDADAAARIYQALSRAAREEVSESSLSGDIARFVGIQDVPDFGVSVEDLQVRGDEAMTLILGLNYSGGLTFRAFNLMVEEGSWKVDSVSIPEGYPTGEGETPPPASADQETLPPYAGDKGGEETVPPPLSTGNSDCVIAGCSSQLCVDATMGDIMTTCEWRDEYACFRTALCERQPDGECGWTPTEELQLCLQAAQGEE